MSKKPNMIFVPRELLEEEIDLNLKMGTLMAFCWIKRYGTIDGYFEAAMDIVMKRYGLHYDESKTKRLPKQASTFIEGLDNLRTKGIITLKNGDYHDIYSFFMLKVNLEGLKKDYISLSLDYFDYIISIEKRINKMGMLYILLFVLSRYVCKKDENGVKRYYRACSYSLDSLSKFTGLSRVSIFKYLTNLSIEEGYEGNAPLVKSKPWYIKINNKIIRFSNIYVENNFDYQEIIKIQREIIAVKLRTKQIDNGQKYDYDLENFIDYDDSDLY